MKAITKVFGLTLVFFVLIISSCHKKIVPSKSTANDNTYKSYNNNTQVDVTNMENDILFYVNKHRRAVGLKDLTMLDAASAEAAKHSANMAARRVAFGHTGFEGRVSAISRSLGTVSAAAENVADGKLTAQQVVDGWLHSPGHKKNIEGSYALTGIGIAKDPGGVIYFTQIFIKK